MKVITEALIRAELKATQSEIYVIPEGKILSPAAREYLQSKQIEISSGKKTDACRMPGANFRQNGAADSENAGHPGHAEQERQSEAPQTQAPTAAKYIDYETGAGYASKPEHMTQLYANMLVNKNHGRIRYRGKLDRLQAEVVNAQCMLNDAGYNELIIRDLGNILDILREMMRCEVMDEPFTNEMIIGLNHEELRKHSHNPMKYYNIKQMLLPDYTMGLAHSQLNLIRTSIREAEVLAVDAFMENRRLVRSDIIEELNRLSSALHIMMCKFLAGEYDAKRTERF